MSQKSKLRKDNIGLYIRSGGWITRPFFGTIFKEGDIINSRHFSGSALVGVNNNNDGINKKKKFEYWSISGITSKEYKEKTLNEVREITDWYKNNITVSHKKIFCEHNKKFEENYKKEHNQ